MASFSERLSLAVLGDPLEKGLLARPTSYEDVHNDVQSIVIPPMFPKGINIHFLQSINKYFALQHRVGLEPGQIKQTMFGPMPGPGNRYYSMGAVVTHVSEQGGKYRVTGQYDAENSVGKCIAVGDVTGDGRLKVTVQAEDRRSEAGPEWGVTAAYRAEESVTVARLKDGLEVGLSHNRRLTSTSPITIGGEVYVSGPRAATAVTNAVQAWRQPKATASDALTTAAAGAGGSSAAASKAKPAAAAAAGPKPYEFAIGAAYDTGLHKTAVHLASTNSFPKVASLHHLYRCTERSSLAAKFMLNLNSGSTMAAAGYRMRFRNTMTTLHGMMDSYGTVRVMVEREPVKDFKIGVSCEGRLSPGALASPGAEGALTMGLQVSMGTTTKLPQQQSPCTMTRTVFGLT